MSRPPLETLATIESRITSLRDAIERRGSVKGDEFIDAMLHVRALARDATSEPAFASNDSAHRQYRLAMVQMELAIDEMIAAQPDTTAEEDQALMDTIMSHFNGLEPFLATLGEPKSHLH